MKLGSSRGRTGSLHAAASLCSGGTGEVSTMLRLRGFERQQLGGLNLELPDGEQTDPLKLLDFHVP